jgi:hypothetical protein
MGEILRPNIDLLIPTQNYLDLKIITYYKMSYMGLKEPFIPIPVAKSGIYENKFPILDGHHNAAACYKLCMKSLIWLANSPDDEIPYEYFPKVSRELIDELNLSIFLRFDNIDSKVQKGTNDESILTIEQLIISKGL